MHEGNRFKSKTLGKSLFHFQNDPTGHGPAGQFRRLESALKNLRPTDDVAKSFLCVPSYALNVITLLLHCVVGTFV